MATLLETLQKRLTAPAQTQATPAINIQEILQAKKGKAAAPARGVQASGVGEAMAQEQAAGALEQQQLLGQVQGAQLGQQAAGVQQAQDLAQERLASQQSQFESGQAAQAAGQRAAVVGGEQLAEQQRVATESLKLQGMNNQATMALQQLASDRGLARDSIFSDAKASNQELAAREDAAELEQTAFILAMQDKSYVDELARVGATRRLGSDLAFQQEMQDVTYGTAMSKMLDSIQFQSGQNVKERDIKKQLAEMSNGEILELAKANADALNTRAMYQGIATIATEGADLAVKANTKKKG